MKILAIETSCDETAVAILECSGDPRKDGVQFNVLSNIVLSQVALHAEYGGVYPSLAKREHSRNLVPVLIQALERAGCKSDKRQGTRDKKNPHTRYQILDTILTREPDLLAQFLEFIPTIQKPPIDAIAVTYGPGLEPALWVGINFAKALALAWNLPIIPINHMEGHFFSALLKKSDDTRYQIPDTKYPLLALLVSGGHTELVLSKDWLNYEIVGETRDDAAGEAFDKVARMLGLGYPGGPAIAQEAARWKSQITKPKSQKNSKFPNGRVTGCSQIPNSRFQFPRPMIDSDNFDFSFSGLKTAVLYQLKKIQKLTPDIVQEFAYEFQEAVVEVLVTKTLHAAEKYEVRSVLLGGGVSANTRLKEALEEKIVAALGNAAFLPAPREFTGDNAVMIGAAAYVRHAIAPREYPISDINAEGTLRIGGKKMDGFPR